MVAKDRRITKEEMQDLIASRGLVAKLSTYYNGQVVVYLLKDNTLVLEEHELKPPLKPDLYHFYKTWTRRWVKRIADSNNGSQEQLAESENFMHHIDEALRRRGLIV